VKEQDSLDSVHRVLRREHTWTLLESFGFALDLPMGLAFSLACLAVRAYFGLRGVLFSSSTPRLPLDSRARNYTRQTPMAVQLQSSVATSAFFAAGQWSGD